MPSKVLSYVRRNHLALIALFFALSGSAVAAGTALTTGSVDSRIVKDRSLRSADLRKKAVDRDSVDLASVSQILQARVKAGCKAGTAIRLITKTGKVTCVAVGGSRDGGGSGGSSGGGGSGGGSAGDIAGVTAGAGLEGGGTAGTVTIAVDPEAVQTRVKGACGDGRAVRAIKQDGTTTCEPVVTGVATGAGLSGGGGPGPVTVGADTSYLQRRVAFGCQAGEAIRSIAEDGAATCQGFGNGNGTVTSVDVEQDSGLTATPGPITTTGTLGVDFGTIQKRVGDTCAGTTALQAISSTGGAECTSPLQQRVTGTCSGTEAVQSVAASGTVGCSTALAPLSSVPASRNVDIVPPSDAAVVSLLSSPYFAIAGRCPASTTEATIEVTANTTMNFLRDSHEDGYDAGGPVTSRRLAATTGNDMGTFILGGVSGPAAGRTFFGQYYVFRTGEGCQFAVGGQAGPT